MPYHFEPMSEQHRRPVVDIFNHFVAHSFAAYPEEPVGDDIFDHFAAMARGYPSLVVKDDAGRVVGFAFLHAYHTARTLRRTAEITTFIMPGHTRQGLGSAILEQFVAEAQTLGVDTILASISSRNEGSIRFHAMSGFFECGRFRRVGRKFGQDFDIVWMQRHLPDRWSEQPESASGDGDRSSRS
jgi:phosphinothricin acetyltransferase